VQTPDIKIWKIFKYCQDKFRKAGISLTFPKNTDPKKTYKWRYLVGFVKKLEEMEASTDAIHQLIEAIIKYATKNKQLHKGLSLLTSERVLSECCDVILQGHISEDKLIDRVKADYKLVAHADLLGKKYARGMSNIVRWYIEGNISEVYLSLSEKCHEAMIKLDKLERCMMPSGKELILARMDILSNHKLKGKIKRAMLNDWRRIFDAS